MNLALSFFLIILSSCCWGQMMKPGQWGGAIHYDDIDIAIQFEVGYPNGEVPEITFINGSERRVISNVSIEGDSVLIPLDPFDVEIRAKFTAMSMEGVYNKYYRDLTIPISADFGKARMQKRSIRPSAPIKNRWAITFSPNSSDESKGVGLFRQRRDIITGTIMTEVSDYRYFEGILDGDSISLSCFDGAHAFAFTGKKSEEGWSGKMVYDNGYEEPWEATYDENVSLIDPFEMVTVEPGKYKPYYDLLGAGEGKNAIKADKYNGKVLVIQLFGTWCPNSHDQTKYLTEWYHENNDRGVEILAASFEANYSQAYGLNRLEKYREVNEIPYDLVLGGRLSKTGAAMPFPFMNKIAAFPTLVILDKQGYVRYVHSYFNGPATGAYYQAFDQQFNEKIDLLINE